MLPHPLHASASSAVKSSAIPRGPKYFAFPLATHGVASYISRSFFTEENYATS